MAKLSLLMISGISRTVTLDHASQFAVDRELRSTGFSNKVYHSQPTVTIRQWITVESAVVER